LVVATRTKEDNVTARNLMVAGRAMSAELITITLCLTVYPATLVTVRLKVQYPNYKTVRTSLVFASVRTMLSERSALSVGTNSSTSLLTTTTGVQSALVTLGVLETTTVTNNRDSVTASRV